MKAIIWPLLFLLLVTTGCNDSENLESQVKDQEAHLLIQEADKLNAFINEGILLRNSTPRDRQRLRSILERIRISSILLDKNPHDRSALLSLKTAFKGHQEVIINERDQAQINSVLDKAYSVMVKYAKLQGVNVDNLSWNLFSYRFSEDIGIFGSSDVPNQWSVRFIQQERYAINVRGENKQAVLLTPTFDLSNVRNPSYQMRHSFQLEEHFIPRPFFNREQILNEAFRVYVSTSYKDGDSVNFRSRSQWTRVSLGKLPTGLNFNTVDSGVIDLSQFEGEKITMAMVYNNNASLGNHILSWSIERFELFGVSDNLQVTARPTPFNPDAQDDLGEEVWTHNFNRVQLGELQQVTVDGAPGDFRNTDRNNVKYVSAGSRGTIGTKLMFSEPINLENSESPRIRIEHSINFYDAQFKAKKNVKLVAAIDDPSKSPSELTWITIDFEKNNPPGSDWSIYKTEFVPLPQELTGKTIRIGWSHTSEEGSSPAWQIHKTEIRDITEL